MGPQSFGYIYRAHTPSMLANRLIKIGTSNDVQRRMRDLSAASGVHENFESWSWFRFETPQSALKVEKHVHSELKKIGLRHKKEFYQDMKVFADAVRECAHKLEEVCLSNYWLESGDIYDKFEAFLPCGYFLLSDSSELRAFRQFSFNMVQFISSLHKFDAGCNGFLSYAFQDVSREFLREHASIPFVCANLLNCPNSELRDWAEGQIENYEDEFFEVFGYDEGWRDKIMAQ